MLCQEFGNADNLELLCIILLKSRIAACAASDHGLGFRLLYLPGVLIHKSGGIETSAKQWRPAALLGRKKSCSKAA